MANDNVMLTTVDNPWNPFTNWDEWYAYDMVYGYDVCGMLDRFSTTSRTLPDSINDEDLDEAMNCLCKDVFPGLFIKVSPESFKDDGTVVPVP